MGTRIDRRNRLALDESYRYYRSLEEGVEPNLFKLTSSICTLSHALYFAELGEFKLTRQLWNRLHQAFFDRLINGFAGTFAVLDASGKRIACGEIPDDGYIEFRADACKRADDAVRIEVAKLYPKTHLVLTHAWKSSRHKLKPADFAQIPDCDHDTGVCMMRPMVLGLDVLNRECQAGKQQAYWKFWDLYLQAYCTPRRNERIVLYKYMSDIQEVWGDLYY